MRKGLQHDVDGRYEPKRALRNSVQVAETWLTNREHTVVTLYTEGLTRSMVADRLSISKKTVDSYLKRSIVKLAAKTIHEAVAMVAVSNSIEGRGRSSNRQSDSVSESTNSERVVTRICP